MGHKISSGVLTACLAIVMLCLAAGILVSQWAWAEERAMVLPTDATRLAVVSAKGAHSFSIEIASEPAQRSAGLMHRVAMPDDHGMLFVFERTQEVGFWMKNTPMPLDLIFIGEDGTIRAIRRGEPQSQALIAPGEPVRFVLELKAGTAARAGMADGDRVEHPAVAAVSSGG